jgi:hypothetical protein
MTDTTDTNPAGDPVPDGGGGADPNAGTGETGTDPATDPTTDEPAPNPDTGTGTDPATPTDPAGADPAAGPEVSRTVSSYDVRVGPYLATVRIDQDQQRGRWYIDSVVIGIAQQALSVAGLITIAEEDPGNARWDDPVAAQDAAEAMLHALYDSVEAVRAVMPPRPTPPPA